MLDATTKINQIMNERTKRDNGKDITKKNH